MRQVNDQVVFALFRVLGGPAGGEHVAFYLVHLVFDVVQRCGQDDGAVPALVYLLRGAHDVAQVAKRLAPVDEEDDNVAADQEEAHEKDYVIAYCDEDAV